MKNKVKKQTKKECLIETIMIRDNAKKEIFNGRIIITHSVASVAIWEYKRGYKPTFHYKFKSLAEMHNFINERKTRILIQVENEKRYLKEGKQAKEKIQPGTILYSSWGYEQTNIDYYIVLSRKNDFVNIVEISKKREYNGADQGTCMPDKSKEIGEIFRKKITQHGTINLNSYSSCSAWDGTKNHFTSYA